MPRPTFLFRPSFEKRVIKNRAFGNRAVGFRAFKVRASALFVFAVVTCFLMSALATHAQAPGVVSGIVLAPDGSPQVHARVYLQPGNGRPPRTVLTDETGHFTFAKVANGMYDVRAQGNGLWSDLYRNVSVKKNDEVSVKLQLKVAPPKSTFKP
jgi:hypothetical protein